MKTTKAFEALKPEELNKRLRRVAQDRLFAARRSSAMARAAKDKAWMESADLREREATAELHRFDSSE